MARRGIGVPARSVLRPVSHERKKRPKKICIKNFGGTPGGQGGGLGAQILYVGVGFPSRIQCIKNLEGGGLRGLGGGV